MTTAARRTMVMANRARAVRNFAFQFILASVLLTAGAHAQQDYPSRPIRIVVPSSPGGGTDILARQIAQKLTERWGQQVIVDNRPGAGQMIGIELVAKAAPDGYTLVMTATLLALNTVLYKKVPYDPVRGFAPISQVAAMPNIIVTHPALPARTIRELIALARSHPGQLVYASSGVGTGPHLSMELFLTMAGVKMGHVPYKSTNPGMIDTMAGQIQVLMSTLLPPLPHIKTGRLRALGVTSSKRVSSLREVPTIAEAGVAGYEVVGWYGIAAPANTPRDVINKLYGEIANILQSPETREKLAADGAEPVGSTPEQFAAFIQSEIDKWGRVVKSSGINVE